MTTALGLLKKILPDMRDTDMSDEGGRSKAWTLTRNELLFEALRGLQEMYAMDAEAIIRRISRPAAEPAGTPAGSGTEDSSTGLEEIGRAHV